MPIIEKAHLLWRFARYFCSAAPQRGDYPGRKANRDATRYTRVLHRTFDSVAVDGGRTPVSEAFTSRVKATAHIVPVMSPEDLRLSKGLL